VVWGGHDLVVSVPLVLSDPRPAKASVFAGAPNTVYLMNICHVLYNGAAGVRAMTLPL
jgi:hypothetical protein